MIGNIVVLRGRMYEQESLNENVLEKDELMQFIEGLRPQITSFHSD